MFILFCLVSSLFPPSLPCLVVFNYIYINAGIEQLLCRRAKMLETRDRQLIANTTRNRIFLSHFQQPHQHQLEDEDDQRRIREAGEEHHNHHRQATNEVSSSFESSSGGESGGSVGEAGGGSSNHKNTNSFTLVSDLAENSSSPRSNINNNNMNAQLNFEQRPPFNNWTHDQSNTMSPSSSSSSSSSSDSSSISPATGHVNLHEPNESSPPPSSTRRSNIYVQVDSNKLAAVSSDANPRKNSPGKLYLLFFFLFQVSSFITKPR